MEGAAAEDGRSPSIWDTFTHAGRLFIFPKLDLGGGIKTFIIHFSNATHLLGSDHFIYFFHQVFG